MSEFGRYRYQSRRDKLCGVVVTYHPGDDLGNNLRAIIAECGSAIVVDNGSGAEACRRFAAIEGVELMALETNRGIAAALNIGAHLASERGCQWMITFDQDSTPAPGFVDALWATHLRLPGSVIVGAHLCETALGKDHRWLRTNPSLNWCFQRVSCAGEDLDDVTVVVTSGALTELSTWQALGGFDERLFIDFVDTDYCLRCRAAGHRVAVSNGARLAHHLGKRGVHVVLGQKFHPTHHSAVRHYYIARNRIPMIGRHAWREPHWFFFECAATVLWMFRVLVAENHKWKKIRAMVLGTWDGLLGRSGPCPERRQRAFTE